jgi:hypothetical protein
VTFAEMCPSIRDNASTFTPAEIEIDAHECLKSCGVITSAAFTALVNHPFVDFGRGRYPPPDQQYRRRTTCSIRCGDAPAPRELLGLARSGRWRGLAESEMLTHGVGLQRVHPQPG